MIILRLAPITINMSAFRVVSAFLLSSLTLTLYPQKVQGYIQRKNQTLPYNLTDLETFLQPNVSFSSISTKRLRRDHDQTPNKFSEEDVFDSTRNGAMICKLCIVVDEKFIKAYKLNDPPSVISFMTKIIDHVSWIFRNIDWNDDGVPDNIGFEMISLVQGWNPFPYERADEYELKRSAVELLGYFAQLDFRSCCLGIGFTNRQFKKDQVGVSFIASEKLLGGICDYRVPVSPLTSSNVVLISGKGLRGTQLSSKDLTMILLHELGHTFGVSKHDNTIDAPECSGYDDTEEILPTDFKSEKNNPPRGRFIMWGQDIQGHATIKANSLNFSPCSRATVKGLLTSGQGRAHCLTVNESIFCGNGIVEYPEECDCGNEVSCAKDGCCGSRGSSGPCQLFKAVTMANCSLILKHDKKVKQEKNISNVIFIQIVDFLFLVILPFIMIWAS